MNKKVISYSLWGDDPKYTVGAIENAKLAQEIYPGWNCYFFIDKNVSTDIIGALSSIENTKIILKNEFADWRGMFWRFETSYDPEVYVSIFRDTDSRLSIREKLAVDEWLDSGKSFHIMRDHPYHKFPILGGMWGYKNTGKYNMEKLFSSFTPDNKYGTDYIFLGGVLYPLIQDDKLVHDEFFDGQPFPSERQNKEFVGDVFDSQNNRHPEYYKYIP